MSQVQNGGPVQAQLSSTDLSNLATNGYINLLQKDQYDQAKADVATMTQLSWDIQNDRTEMGTAQSTLAKQTQKTQSFFFHFEGGDKKQADINTLETAKTTISRDQMDINTKETRIAELIQKKSMLDRMVQYNDGHVSLTGQGIVALADLNVRNYRVADMDFTDFVNESTDTYNQLRLIAQNGAYYVSQLNRDITLSDLDLRALHWSVGIGLAKLQGDPMQIAQRFLIAVNDLKHFGSNIDNRLMAAEIMTSFRAQPSQSATDNSDLDQLSNSLKNIEKDVKHHGHVPGQLSAGVSSIILSGRKYDGSFPTDRFLEFNKMTKSYESAAILSVLNVPSDQLYARFQRFRDLFSSWGYEMSEDTELSSAYLSIAGFEPDDVRTKMVVLLEGLHNYLEYPIVAGAILASIPTLEANETLDLMEKAYSILAPFSGLERAETISLAVRMIHGIKNEIVRQVDPTARLANTPVQFTYAPGWGIFVYHRPIIIAHSSYFSTFGGLSGSHPAHVHGYGGGGFGG